MKLFAGLGLGLALISSSAVVNAQSDFASCANAPLEFVESGTRFGGNVIRSTNRACGANGFVCVSGGNLEAAGAVNAVYAAALTAQATGATVQLQWDRADRGCGTANYPILTQLRIIAE